MHKNIAQWKRTHKPVLFPSIVSACIGLTDLGCEHPHDIHKQDEVQLKKRVQRE